MGKSFTRNDNFMIDGSVVAMDASGNPLSNAFLHLSTTFAVSSTTTTVTDSRITSSMRVVNAEFGTPSSLTSDVSWTTSNGSIVFTYTLATDATTTISFDLVMFQT